MDDSSSEDEKTQISNRKEKVMTAASIDIDSTDDEVGKVQEFYFDSFLTIVSVPSVPYTVILNLMVSSKILYLL